MVHFSHTCGTERGTCVGLTLRAAWGRFPGTEPLPLPEKALAEVCATTSWRRQISQHMCFAPCAPAPAPCPRPQSHGPFCCGGSPGGGYTGFQPVRLGLGPCLPSSGSLLRTNSQLLPPGEAWLAHPASSSLGSGERSSCPGLTVAQPKVCLGPLIPVGTGGPPLPCSLQRPAGEMVAPSVPTPASPRERLDSPKRRAVPSCSWPGTVPRRVP